MRLVSSILLAIYVLCSTVQLLRAECSGSYVCKFQDVCGISEPVMRAAPYVPGGLEKSARQFPWTAQVIAARYDRREAGGSGTLISDRHVWTAANIFEGIQYDSVYVYLGTGVGISFPAHHHRWYRAESVCIIRAKPDEGGDWAIITLEDPVKFSDYVGPACWTDTQESPMDFCYIAGLGMDGGPVTNWNIMRVGEVKCPPEWTNEYHACFLGAHQFDGANVFEEDTGGGLVCLDEKSGRWQLRGNVFTYFSTGSPLRCATGLGSLVHSTQKESLEACGVRLPDWNNRTKSRW